MQQHARVAHGVAPLLLPARWQQQWRDAVRDPRVLLQLLG
ncbi:EF-P beta-lysylation protein EpmB, partial [Xanthomonas perforans]